ncbi:MBL fold metallo-hydrolase [Aestuariivita boseongensis]|uniref:MBL fold metallo-hydrolase n=1 Tax=Aestuariivita boseongensis TaxID=1470562 RepID=UPI000680C33E|nr:MBL fold metallo-hydrolase [Aestuariivita boseongensis]
MLTRIGDVEIWRILESVDPLYEPGFIFPNIDPDGAELLERAAPGCICAKSGKLSLPIQGFLLRTPDHTILVDSCVGNHKTTRVPAWNKRETGRFMASLAAAGVGPDDIDYVMCTHLHVDHVGWNTRLENGVWVPTFRKARYLLPEADVEFFGAEGGPTYTESVLPVNAAGLSETVSGAHQIGEAVRLVPTPGHSPGHVAVEIISRGDRALITGDALHTTVQCARPEWHFVYDADPVQAVASRRSLLEHTSEGGHLVIGSHFWLPSVGRTQVNGSAFDWVPH